MTGIPGMSVAIIHKGKLIFAEGFGKRNGRDPFTAETVSMIGSLTKAFTSGAVGELVAEGVVDWNTTPVSTYLPEFQLQDPGFSSQITLADVFSHRTGFPIVDYLWAYSTESRLDLIKRMKYVKCGTKMQPFVSYNNMMYAVGGYAAAKAAGVEYEDLVDEKIFKPLNLKKTGFTMQGMTKFKNYASPYEADTYEDALNGKFTKLPLTNMADAGAPAGNIYSTALDLVRWGQTIMKHGEMDGKQVLNKNSIIEILSGQSIYSRYSPGGAYSEFPYTTTYGLGWILDSYKGNTMIWHTGAIDGYATSLALFPDSELVIAHLTNSQGAFLPNALPYYIADEVLGLPKTHDWIQRGIDITKIVYGQKPQVLTGGHPPQIKNAPMSHKLNDFAGVYTDLVYGDLPITLVKNDKGEEELNFKLHVFENRLSHYHYDSFNTTATYGATVLPVLVTFATGTDGKVSGLSVTSRTLSIDFNFQKKN
ncbi:hypothetical protein BGZ76_000254 [Entomortierella beljakovae]|nr:hypothetical protein BGZ76_000254 [Entomortierella beljakovae]